MKGIIFLRLLVVSFTVFVGVSVLTAQTSDKLNDELIYKHSKLSFSLQYPATLMAWEFPDGVSITDETRTIYDGKIDILITNTALERDRYYVDWAAKHFWRLRKAKEGKIFKDDEFSNSLYTKVENLTLNGYPAVKVINEVKREQNLRTLPNLGMSPPSIYAVSIYFQKGKNIWEITSLSISKEQQEKNIPIFEGVWKSLKFR
jgi:hypothetical protein